MLLIGYPVTNCCSWTPWHADARGLELLQLVAQRPRADAEALCGQFAVAAGDAQRRQYQFAFTLFQVAVQTRIQRRRRLHRYARLAPPCAAVPVSRSAAPMLPPTASQAARCTMLFNSRAFPGQS